MTPCYAPFKNLLIVLENAFEVIVKDKNNIFLRKTTKKRQKMEKKTPFFQTAAHLPTRVCGRCFLEACSRYLNNASSLLLEIHAVVLS